MSAVFDRDRSAELRSALIRLLADMSYKDIRANQIASEAGVSRNTFYRCYNNKDQVISAIYDEVVGRCLDEIEVELNEVEQPPADPVRVVYNIVLKIFIGMEESRETARLLFASQVDDIIYSRFSLFWRRLFGKLIRRQNRHVDDERLVEFLVSHLTGSAFHFFKEWILAEDPPPTERIAELYSRILTPSLQMIVELSSE